MIGNEEEAMLVAEVHSIASIPTHCFFLADRACLLLDFEKKTCYILLRKQSDDMAWSLEVLLNENCILGKEGAKSSIYKLSFKGIDLLRYLRINSDVSS